MSGPSGVGTNKRIEIHPDHQGQGIGSQLVRDLLDQAATSDRSVVLDVFSINHRAQSLYQRLGFTPDTSRDPRQHQNQNDGKTQSHPQVLTISQASAPDPYRAPPLLPATTGCTAEHFGHNVEP
jgi:ribosomal protein S18 acetylase RimI-like enzyme